MGVKETAAYHLDTLAIHAGQPPEKVTGAVMTPIFQTSTYAQHQPSDGPWQHASWEYSRTHNPTRTALQDCVAALEEGRHGIAFSSGVATIDAIVRLLKPGDLILCGDDVYGGTYRLFTRFWQNYGLKFAFVDTSDPNLKVPLETKMIWVETPTNPLLKITDIQQISQKCQDVGAILVVDNTFATPVFQKPLLLGADIVMHSMTKYLNGHSDVIGGIAITNSDDLAERLSWLQNAAGGVPGPQDCFLILRGLKTLHVRMAKHQENAQQIVAWMKSQPQIKKVMYPGFSGMISFILDGDLAASQRFVTATQLFTLAESLGGVESLIELPAIMTHASVPPEVRKDLGIEDGLIRLSVGIEHIDDLIQDLKQALKTALNNRNGQDCVRE